MSKYQVQVDFNNNTGYTKDHCSTWLVLRTLWIFMVSYDNEIPATISITKEQNGEPNHE